MSPAKIADTYGLAPSSVRNSHSGAIRNLRADDELFEVLKAVGKCATTLAAKRSRQPHGALPEAAPVTARS